MHRVLFAFPFAAFLAGCSGTAATITCGPGTTQEGTRCVASGGDAGIVDGGTDGEEGFAGPTAPTFAGVTSVSPASSSTLLVTWAPAKDTTTVDALLRYQVYVGTTAAGQNFAAPMVVTPPGARSVLLTGLTEGTPYYVVVRALNGASLHDDNVAELNGTPQTDSVAPTFAGAKAVATSGSSGVTLSWNAATDDKTGAPGLGYLVYATDTAGVFDYTRPFALVAPGQTSIALTGLPRPNTPYFFVVRAVDAAGNVDTNTASVSGTSGFDTSPPTFAGCQAAVVKDAASVGVAWAAATDDSTPSAQITYDVFVATEQGKQDFSTPAATFVGTTQGSIDGLAQNTAYYFVCRARDASGNAERNQTERVARTPADPTPPTFAGLASIGTVTATDVQLTWAAATDNLTSSADIVYDVYQAEQSGTQNYANPPKVTSAPGATSIVLQGLPPGKVLYWVVRARDKAGNRDSNTVEKSAATKVSFAFNVQPIFNNHCAVEGCHVGTSAPYTLALSAGVSFSNLVNVTAGSASPAVRVSPGAPADSILYLRVTGASGALMPPASTQDSLDANEKLVLYQWIAQGALNN